MYRIPCQNEIKSVLLNIIYFKLNFLFSYEVCTCNKDLIKPFNSQKLLSLNFVINILL